MKKIFFILVVTLLFSSTYALNGKPYNPSNIDEILNSTQKTEVYNKNITINNTPNNNSNIGNAGNTNRNIGSDNGGGNGPSN